jgi:hypothetical protein
MDNTTVTTEVFPPPSTIPPSSTTKPSLQTLPLDLLLHLSSLLDYPSLLNLSSTSRALRGAINPDELCPLEDKTAFYLQAELFPQHEERLACFACWRMLDKNKFGDSKRRGRYGKYSPNHTGGAREKRFCWECGVQGRRYGHLKRVNKDGVGYYPCHRCGVARVGRERCLREGCFTGGVWWGVRAREVA